jgi:integrase
MFTVHYLNSLQSKHSPYRKYEKASRVGFGIQISAKGAKTFFYAYTIKGKQRFIKLGIFTDKSNNSIGGITLKEAGLLWQKWHKVRSSGYDPQIIRDNEIRATEKAHHKAEETKKRQQQQGSYQQLLNLYIDWLKKNKKRSAENVQQVINANAYKVIHPVTKAKEVSSRDLNATLAIMEKRGANILANRLRSYLLTAFTKGMAFDFGRSQNTSTIQFGLKHNPVRDVPKSEVKERVGERFLSEEEINTLWYGLANTRMSPQIICLLKLLLATGQRVEEVLHLNINAIDWNTQLWELTHTKSKRPHVVPLPPIANRLINELQADKDGFLFISAKTGKFIRADSIPQACQRYCTQTGFKKFTPRSLRRTWKTLVGKAGVSKFDRDRYQNHVINDVSGRHYDRYDYLAEKRQVAQVWDHYLSNIILS